MKKIIIYAFCLLLLLCAACGTAAPAEPDDPQTSVEDPAQPDTPQESDTPTAQEPDTPKEPDTPQEPDTHETSPGPTGNINPLTGLHDGISDTALTRRPLAIMVGNSRDALPQWGVSQADIIYEMIAEARITRLLAIFQNPSKIEKIASIRSSRPYFIDIAQSYGAVYLHFGGSVPAYEAIAARSDLISIDGIKGSWEGTVLFRDPERRKQIGYEHSVYSTGAYLEKALARLKSDLTQTEHPSAFNFASESSAASGASALSVKLTFSSYHKPYFTYDAETGTYLRFEYDAPHMDGCQNKQIAVKNLLVICMELTNIPGDTLGIVDITTCGTGRGYYFCDGKYVPISWSKDAYNTPIRYFTESGAELVCKRGQSFVSVVSALSNVSIG